MKTLRPLILSLAALSAAGAAQAQFAKAEDAIEYRQGALFVMAQHFTRVAAMANGKVPFDAKAAADNAALAEVLAKLPWAAFGEGTASGHNTKAKPVIWEEKDKFMALADKMQGEMSKLAQASKTGNLDSIKAAVGATGKSCKECHDAYRSR